MLKTIFERGEYRLALGLLAVTLASGCGPQDPIPEAAHFARLDARGQVIEAAGVPHHCVRDLRTGLMWQVEGEGLHSRDDTFSWYNSERQGHMSEPGLMDGGQCGLDRCDTEALVAAVNARGLCGHNDWRLPTLEEAMTLSDRRRIDTGMTLDPVYFPDAVAGEYWTATTFRLHAPGAWAVDTRNALDRVDSKTAAKAVRLVRGPGPVLMEASR